MSWIPSYKKILKPYVPPSWSTGTDAEIAEALDKHYAGEIDLHDYWSVGDERTVPLSNMSGNWYYESRDGVYYGEGHSAQNVKFVLSNVGGFMLADGVTECAFQVDQKDTLGAYETGTLYRPDSAGALSFYNYSVQGWESFNRYTAPQSSGPTVSWFKLFHDALPEALQPVFKQFQYTSYNSVNYTHETLTDYFTFRSPKELTGQEKGESEPNTSQVEWYETASNRIKEVIPWTQGYVPYGYWLRTVYSYGSDHASNSTYFNYFDTHSSTKTVNSNAASDKYNMVMSVFGVI